MQTAANLEEFFMVWLSGKACGSLPRIDAAPAIPASKKPMAGNANGRWIRRVPNHITAKTKVSPPRSLYAREPSPHPPGLPATSAMRHSPDAPTATPWRRWRASATAWSSAPPTAPAPIRAAVSAARRPVRHRCAARTARRVCRGVSASDTTCFAPAVAACAARVAGWSYSWRPKNCLASAANSARVAANGEACRSCSCRNCASATPAAPR